MNRIDPIKSKIEWGEPPYDRAVREATDGLYAKVRHAITPMEWPRIAALVHAINRLKRDRNALILAHNYMTPDIFSLVGDICGDSLQLAISAREAKAEIIVQAGVLFMAETSKILCPDKTVLIPDRRAGCSLSASITGADMRLIRQAYPDVPIIAYVNTSAEVKAECDITCTSANAVAIAEHIAGAWDTRRVIMVPDRYLAHNVSANTDLEVLTWPGACEVHERFSAGDVAEIRAAHPGVVVLAHPECPAEVLEVADFAGSTSALSAYVGEHNPAQVVLLTECSMSDNVATANPTTHFVRPCNLCPHMKRIDLEGLYNCLTTNETEIVLDEAVRARAEQAIAAMLSAPLSKGAGFRTGIKSPAPTLVSLPSPPGADQLRTRIDLNASQVSPTHQTFRHCRTGGGRGRSWRRGTR